MNSRIKIINFDMDGTLFDLYGVENWLAKLHAADPSPYAEAAPMLDMKKLAWLCRKLQSKGWKINIVSWLAKGSSAPYDEAVTLAKISAIRSAFPDFWFNNVHIVPYGTPKAEIECGILFDDEPKNRIDWCNASHDNSAYNVNNILEILEMLI